MSKATFFCKSCGNESSQWSGCCSACGEWNSLTVFKIPKTLEKNTKKSNIISGFSPQDKQNKQGPIKLSEVILKPQHRLSTGIKELDRVLGNGMVPGSVILIGGDPGVGKSTLLLQTLSRLSGKGPWLYVTGEESLEQMAEHASRMQLSCDAVEVLAETCVEAILKAAYVLKPKVLVIDSIQTVVTESSQSIPGSVNQVRESALRLVHFAKRMQTVIFLIGHVTKEGALAGPRILEHMVDTVLYFEGEKDSRWRLIRSVKNRFGSVNELGVFAMTDKGLAEVNNPSALFLSKATQPIPGSAITVIWEGSRPLLIEVQALLDQSYLTNPRRLALGWESSRLAMLLAILHKHGQVTTQDQDIFVNIVGGLRITETSADLALIAAMLSSFYNKCLPGDFIVFGELGLAGEIRPIPRGGERFQEAVKHGFKCIMLPKANKPKKIPKNIDIYSVSSLHQALTIFQDIFQR